MALPAAFLSAVSDPRALANLLHNRNGNTPLTLPGSARGTPPANAVPNAGADSVELSGQPAPQSDGRVAVDGSGVYRLLQATSLNLNAQSLRVRLGSGGGGESGRGALGVVSNALGAAPATGSGLMGRLRDSLEKLGLSDKNVRDLLLVAGMLEKLDPEAFERFVQSMESFAAKVTESAAPAAQAQAPAAPAPAQGGAQSFTLNYVSINISFTEVTAAAASGADGTAAEVTARHFEVRFERLEVSLQSQQAQPPQGDPVVLDVAGDGADLRPTSDGVRFDLTGSGQPVQTAFVQGDDALLFYDANANGLLDDGRELVGNRVPGLDGMSELAAMDADGDGWVNALDPAWQGLRLFQDSNGDGQSAPGEVKLLEALGITGLSALWERADQLDGEGLRRAGTSAFQRADGSQGLMLDYYFGYRPAPEPQA